MNNMIRLTPFECEQGGPIAAFEAYFGFATDGALWLRYIVETDDGAVKLPPITIAARTDNLWQSTCFELFIKEEGAANYLEFNFSPSGHWAAYSFSGYRDGMRNFELPADPDVNIEGGGYWFAIDVSLALPHSWRNKALQANLAAVIEAADGELTYWAAQHAAARPDFHDPGCFVLTLAAGEQQ